LPKSSIALPVVIWPDALSSTNEKAIAAIPKACFNFIVVIIDILRIQAVRLDGG
jgi:hypothetical protein